MSAREVELTGGAPWGFRMHGGVDHNQPLRISRVNPGRKASLSGIREGDVISSINGRPTKCMTNADAHAMLRSAGPVLRLGLNEDREMSPRRRSIGRGSELKRPSQLIAETQKATPQGPVYATIRPSHSPQARPCSSPVRSSLNSLPVALNATPLVKSAADEPPRFHPTNPFYTTLPSNYSSASKLPVPNGRASLAGLDKNKSRDTSSYNDYGSDLKSPSYFTKTYDSGPSSLPYLNHDTGHMNGYESVASKTTTSETNDPFSRNMYNQYDNQGVRNESSVNKNPFETKRNSDPFEKYLRPENKVNGKCEFDSKTMPNSHSDNSFRRSEEVSKRSTITEEKISSIEEVKTIKKIILNGSGDSSEYNQNFNFDARAPAMSSGMNRFDFNSHSQPKDCYFDSIRNDHSPTHRRKDFFESPSEFGHNQYIPSTHQSSKDYTNGSPTAEAASSEVVASKPPVKSSSAAPAPPPVHTPTPKREYQLTWVRYLPTQGRILCNFNGYLQECESGPIKNNLTQSIGYRTDFKFEDFFRY